MTRLVTLLVCLGACSNAWPKGTTIRAVGTREWQAEVYASIDAWRDALGPDCPFPYVIDYTSNSGKPIVLVDPSGWDSNEVFSAAENHARINVKGPVVLGRRLEIEHELGHAFGLVHSKTPGTLMYYMGGVMTPEDIRRARAALGCR